MLCPFGVPRSAWFEKGTSNTTARHYATLYTTLHFTTLYYTTLHYTTLHYTTLHYTTLHCTTHHTTLHYTTLHTLHYTTLYSSTTLDSPPREYTTGRPHLQLQKHFDKLVLGVHFVEPCHVLLADAVDRLRDPAHQRRSICLSPGT
jgi:hypothetical protein